ncbi:MAG: UDP-hydrolyzing UDP-N-acetyl-D-glucosamine 2-epimerase [Candidatus Azotimanducaceae bacterium]|jgi:UDP-hydrolysing UDP-N-acetyl-D-glucosamine 2-epimerase
MRRILIFTGTRAEYGLLFWLLKEIQASDSLALQIVATGSHLSPEFGLTYQQIESDGFAIDEKCEILLSSDTPVGVLKSMGLATISLAESFSRLSPDVLVILGDRFEALAAAQTALILKIPILHIHGGELTEGAYDDAIRHSITKMSTYHCTTTEEHRRRVIQMGEKPDRVKNVGAPGLDHVSKTALMSSEELSASISFRLDRPFFLITYHPETMSKRGAIDDFGHLLTALDCFSDHQIVFTYPNADEGGRQIIALIDDYVATSGGRVVGVPSLGQVRYLSAMKHCRLVIGNSSSGIIEAPSFHVPTINVGNRQKGRAAAASVIHCDVERDAIVRSIRLGLSETFRNDELVYANPYGRGDASGQIRKVLETMVLDPIKSFFDQPEVRTQ